ncbi:Thioesterase domain-containing [Pyrenophora seminiperda CCB06]|uniref:Thioesterase domain-containing n=1 Tax=Pyrenophora seminiperda CCB06 TaxID=1302712 RepID=A0A3M7MFR7_9PLEO|nr:Thioesterase domain-containing [Pyrenophora seminiperda CCB06]
MERPPAYQPVCRDEEENILEESEEKDGVSWNSNSTEIIPTNTRSFVAYLSLLLLSLSANILLVMDNAKLRISHIPARSNFSGLAFDTDVPYHAMTKYWHPNASDSEMEAAWDAIDTNAMAVALDDRFAEHIGLPPSTRFPWDTERSVYYVKGIHDVHCLKLIRKAIASKHNGSDKSFNLLHIYHCLDGLRQDIMCIADDTPMPAPFAHQTGDGQIRQCRDWNKLVAWATRPDRHACYEFDDYRDATNTLENFAFCPPESPYRDFQQAYFDHHGHKDTYEQNGNEDEFVEF